MADTSELANRAADTLLPTSAFYALNYHFGMLLGVDDFQTEQAYHRGKSRLHNAWMHREGVVWGFKVTLDKEHDEIHVSRGLALDPAGHELHLDEDVCLSVPAWFAELPEADRERLAGANGTDPFGAHVLICHRACLTRPVPALMEICEGSGRDTACSRVFETVEIVLVPDLAPTPPAPPYHRVRLMLGLADPRQSLTSGTEEEIESAALAVAEDAQILAERDALLAEPREERLDLALDLLRDCGARDTAELAPAKDADGEEWLLFPGRDDAGIVLADLKGLALTPGADGLQLSSGAVDYGPRPSHLATRTIQELAAAAFFCCPTNESDGATGEGPRADPNRVVFKGKTVSFLVDATLHPGSVKPEAFAVSAFVSQSGWKLYEVKGADYRKRRLGYAVVLTLAEAIKGDLFRLVARGTGPTPLLGADLKPFAGAFGDPPAPEGRDFVYTHKHAPKES